MNPIRRLIHPTVKILDAAKGLVEYVASNQTIDCYREVILAAGWRFTNFAKNAPFVDSHNYGTIENLLGKVVDFRVEGQSLVETVQWAKEVAENSLAKLGWAMTEAGFLKAVSVGFTPTRAVSKWDADTRLFFQQCEQLGLGADQVRVIYQEQEQLELSACIIGANPDALCKAYKSGVLTDAHLDLISQKRATQETANAADDLGLAAAAHGRARAEFLRKFETTLKTV